MTKKILYFRKATTWTRRVVRWTVLPGRPYSENTVLSSQGAKSVFGNRVWKPPHRAEDKREWHSRNNSLKFFPILSQTDGNYPAESFNDSERKNFQFRIRKFGQTEKLLQFARGLKYRARKSRERTKRKILGTPPPFEAARKESLKARGTKIKRFTCKAFAASAVMAPYKKRKRVSKFQN